LPACSPHYPFNADVTTMKISINQWQPINYKLHKLFY